MKAIVSDNNTETGAETVSFPKNDNPNQIIPKQERNAIMNKSEQPVAIVTGASSGIGLGITQALLERGWSVVGTSRTISKSKELQASPHLVLVDGEASKKETAVQVMKAAIKHFGRIDLLVNQRRHFCPQAVHRLHRG